MNNVIIHQGQAISKNSDAYKLWEAKKWKELEAHMKAVHEAAKKRGEIR